MRAILTGLLVIWTMAGFANVACAQGAKAFSKAEFTRSCAPRHGVTGKGDGPVAKSLARAPADLTSLSQRNAGVFPVSSIYDVIDGRTQISAHGPREMPVWGDAYVREMRTRWPPAFLSDELVQIMSRVRILMLIEYISTLQEN